MKLITRYIRVSGMKLHFHICGPVFEMLDREGKFKSLQDSLGGGSMSLMSGIPF